MRLNSFVLKNFSGLDHVEVSNLSDVVVLAGPNGVGKTRLLRALIDFFKNPQPNAPIEMTIEATSESEIKLWGKSILSTASPNDANHLRNILQRSQKRNKYRSTILNFDSDRSISQIKPYKFSWDIQDPYEEEVGWDLSYNHLKDRSQDVRDSLFKLVESQRRKISDQAIGLKAAGKETMALDFPDPLEKFKAAFSQLLAPKKLLGLEARYQKINYEYEGDVFPLESLSSGEQEVVNIIFDFLLRNPSNCIVFFDEPELHLHPELSYKLLQVLASIGKNNQFIFCTHSPEIITASIENSVIFLTPKKPDHSNQALMVSKDDVTYHALNLLGQSIGIISLGKKLLLIEGDEASLDKQTYGAILKNEFPELVMVPVGGKSTIKSFEEVQRSVLNQTIWGVEFFMLCDRDAKYQLGYKNFDEQASPRLKLLPRYHLENYFLDSAIYARIFSEMEVGDSWLCDESKITERLLGFAKETIPYAVALKVAAEVREKIGNVDLMIKGMKGDTDLNALIGIIKTRISTEHSRVAQNLDENAIEAIATAEYTRLMDSIASNSEIWKRDIPGRIILNRFAASAGLQSGRLKTLYLRHAAEANTDPFIDIRKIFRDFRSMA